MYVILKRLVIMVLPFIYVYYVQFKVTNFEVASSESILQFNLSSLNFIKILHLLLIFFNDYL